jgi:hypothetical protein
MPHGKDKYRSRRNRARVREILWREWDPIGVNDSKEAIDEYDAYADRAYILLMDERRSAEEIADYLFDIASNYIGLGPKLSLRILSRKVANKIFGLVAEFEVESNEPF